MKNPTKKWKKWLNETAPTKKYFGDVPKNISDVSPKDQHYNRAVTAAMGQEDFRSTFKIWLGQFMVNSKRSGDIEWLAENIKPEDKIQAAKDLNIMRFIYSGKSKFDTVGKGHFGITGTLYDNQPMVTGSAVEKIDFTLEQIGMPVTHATPTDEEQEEVYIYYINPNWSLTKAPEPSPEVKSRFAKNVALSQTSAFQKRQAELDAMNRQREIERKRELARRRRERRRNR
jgi:hypothetical protein